MSPQSEKNTVKINTRNALKNNIPISIIHQKSKRKEAKMSFRQSDIFNNNFLLWKIFGLWSGRNPNKNYKYYSAAYLFITLVMYNILLTLNLAFTPREIEYLIREVIFSFTEIAVMSKVFMIIVMRDKILEAFSLMDGKDLEGDDKSSIDIIEKARTGFTAYWKIFATISHVAYSSQVFVPIVLYFVFNSELDLPICKYYFLSDELRNRYFIFWFMYQSWGIYGHMIYNVTVDSFIAGMLVFAVVQLNILNVKLRNLKLSDEEKKLSAEDQENIQMLRLRNCLVRYDVLLRYCDTMQRILDVTMFIVFAMSSIIICVVLCGLLLPSSMETMVFMVTYLLAMTLQIFVPGYLGTLLNYESRELVFAAYCTEWIPRSESFKRSIRVFVGRANKPIQVTALKMFPLSLSTFTSIVKTAYSFFALIKSFQD